MKLIRRTKLALVSMGILTLTAGITLSTVSPAEAAVNGTVVCGAYSSSYPVVGVWIDSTNNSHDGWATVIHISGQPWKVKFSKSDINESYSVHVGCGGKKSDWEQEAKSGFATGPQDFICHVSFVANQRICAF